jgi:hypothetical protein
VAVVVVLATSIITPIISAVTALVVTAITLVVVMPVVVVLATIIVSSVIAAVISSIRVIIAMIEPAVTVITSIRSMITVVEALVTVLVVVVAALGLLGVGGYSKGMLQLVTLTHGMFSITVGLALVVHDHVKISFEEGGGSWWIYHVSFTRSLTRPVSSIAVFSIEVVHHRVLSVDQLVDVSHEVSDGMCVSFMDLFEELDVEPQEWYLAHHKGEVSCHVVFVASRGACCNVVHLEPYTWIGATVVLLNGWLEVLGVSDRPETS